jgi:hypothetical protein
VTARTNRLHTRSTGAVAAAVLAVLLLALTSACSNGGGTKVTTSPAAAVRAAATKAANAKTAHMEMTETISGPADLTLTMTGDFDRDAQRAHLTVKSANVDLEEIQDHNTAYIRLGSSKQWTRVELDPSITQKITDQLNPAQGQLALLEKLGVDVKEVGDLTTDGTKVTHYAGTIDWRKLLETVGAVGVAPSSAIDQLESQVDDGSGTADVYIDSSGLVRRSSLTLALTADGDTLHIEAENNLSRYNEPVDITVPDPADVVATKKAGTLQEFTQIVAGIASAGASIPS